MTRMADKIMERVATHERGTWVCTPKDVLDLGSREAVDQALSRLVKGYKDLPKLLRALKELRPESAASRSKAA